MRWAMVLMVLAACADDDYWTHKQLSACVAADYFVRAQAIEAGITAGSGMDVLTAAIALRRDVGGFLEVAAICAPFTPPPADRVTTNCSMQGCSFTVTAPRGDGSIYTLDGEALLDLGKLTFRVHDRSPEFDIYTSGSVVLDGPMSGQVKRSQSTDSIQAEYRGVEVNEGGCPIAGTLDVTRYYETESDPVHHPGEKGSLTFGPSCMR